MKRFALAALAAIALLIGGCAGSFSTADRATLETAALDNPSDIDPGDGYTSQTECEVLGGEWKQSGGGGGSGVPSGFSFPHCDRDGSAGVPGGPYFGPTIVGRSGTALQ